MKNKTDWEKRWSGKLKELDKLSEQLYNKNDFAESDVVEFGFKVLSKDEIFTVVDFGNIKKFIQKELDRQREYLLEQFDLELEAWMYVHEEMKRNFDTKDLIKHMQSKLKSKSNEKVI
jgi:hypothetical protein